MLVRELSPIRAATVGALAVALAAGCGAAPPPGGGNHSARQAVTIKVSPAVASRGEERARDYALRLLAEIQLPAGAQAAARSVGDLSNLEPMLPRHISDTIDARALYEVKLGMSAVGHFLIGHMPPDMKLAENGHAGQVGVALGAYLNFAPKNLPHMFFHAEIGTAVIPARHGSLLRVDAQVTWYPRRSSAEHVNSLTYRAVTVTAPAGSRRSVTRTFSSREVVTRLAALINRMPAQPSFTEFCPSIPIKPYSITFTPRDGQWQRIVVRPSGCFSDGITVGGRAQPPLHDHGNAMIAALNRLLALQTG